MSKIIKMVWQLLPPLREDLIPFFDWLFSVRANQSKPWFECVCHIMFYFWLRTRTMGPFWSHSWLVQCIHSQPIRKDCIQTHFWVVQQTNFSGKSEKFNILKLALANWLLRLHNDEWLHVYHTEHVLHLKPSTISWPLSVRRFLENLLSPLYKQLWYETRLKTHHTIFSILIIYIMMSYVFTLVN